MHVIVAYAASARFAFSDWSALRLPHLQRLLAGMQRTQVLSDAQALHPHPLLAHERADALARGWPDLGPWPWAAAEVSHELATRLSLQPPPLSSLQSTHEAPGEVVAQAWLTPCHWQVGMDQVFMHPPQHLALSEAHARQLLQAMQPYFESEGLHLHWHSASRWRLSSTAPAASGHWLAQVASASLARVAGANVRPWITGAGLPRPWLALHSEMQMLLNQHPVNDERLAQGQPSVNALWLHGAGVAPAAASSVRPAAPLCLLELEAAALQADAAQWQAVWQRIDREVLAPLCWPRRGDAGEAGEAAGAGGSTAPGPLTLTLCSESSAHRYTRQHLPWPQRLLRRLRPPQAAQALQALLDEGQNEANSEANSEANNEANNETENPQAASAPTSHQGSQP